MKAIKQVIIIVVILIAVGVVISFFLPSEVNIVEETEINAPIDSVFYDVSNLKKWEAWKFWGEEDSNLAVKYTSIKGSKQNNPMDVAIYWQNKNTYIYGEKSIIKKQIPDESITFDYYFHREDKNPSQLKWTFQPVGKSNNKTKVKIHWYFEIGNGPINKIFGALADYRALFVPKAQLALQQLKQYEEKIHNTDSDKIKIVEIKQAHLLLAIKDTISNDSLREKIPQLFNKLIDYCKQVDVIKIGVPVIKYEAYQDQQNILIAGILIEDSIPVNNGYFYSQTPKGKALRFLHKGSYHSIQSSYKEMLDWMKEHAEAPAGMPWEIYLKWGKNTKDTSKWETAIYYPL